MARARATYVWLLLPARHAAVTHAGLAALRHNQLLAMLVQICQDFEPVLVLVACVHRTEEGVFVPHV